MPCSGLLRRAPAPWRGRGMRRAARPSSWQRRRAARLRAAAAPAAPSVASGAPGPQHAGGDAGRAGSGVGCAAGACYGRGRPAGAAALPAALGFQAYPLVSVGACQAAGAATGSAAGTRHGPGGLPGGHACAPIGAPDANPRPAGSGGGARALAGRGGGGQPAASRRASQRAPRGWVAPADVTLPRQRIFHTARFSAKTGLPAGRARPACCQSCSAPAPHGQKSVHGGARVRQ